MISVPILRDQYAIRWPSSDRQPSATDALPLAEALTRSFRTTAHTTQYAPRGVALKGEAVDLGVYPVMQLAIFDTDDKIAHQRGSPANGSWRRAFWERCVLLLSRHPGLYIYETRGGARIVGVLPRPLCIRSRSDAAVWSQLYTAWVVYIQRRFSIEVDNLHDWTRIFKLPRCSRDGGPPEDRIAFGDAANVGIWDPDLREAWRSAPSYNRTTAVGSNAGCAHIARMLHARGWIGRELERGTKWSCICPASVQYGEHGRNDTSCVVWANDKLHCSHDRCQEWQADGKSARLWDWFSVDERKQVLHSLDLTWHVDGPA